MNKPIRCVFLGYMWKLARSLIESKNIELIGVGIESQRIRSPEAKLFFEQSGISCFEAAKIRSNDTFASMLENGIDLIVVGAFGQILSPEIIGKVNSNVLNVHTSLLPAYRGGSPIESQILAGDTMG